MDTIKTLAAVKAMVDELFKRNEKPYLLYHNIVHTHHVVKRTQEIAGFYELNNEDLFVLQTAAWFHDTGHLLGVLERHEEAGVRLMVNFLSDRVWEPVLDRIAHCIMATSSLVKPVSLVEMILCDADTYHLGTPEFRQTDTLVWQELEKRTGQIVERKYELSLRFLESHTFYTEYCRNLLNPGKQDNIEWLKQKIVTG